ncbi:amino acid adenylation domain-containing protein [Streptomyces calvus]|uniref:Amino acid adenylation domain-containing protein n=1 Tax=Streptomyces calvus TaxID=67282 RepID=A0AA40SGP7_9ACTN|nr:non-ribosomal peptide synthetase [Streptomyces calvus]MBA8945826.1 amino acid adenylation domain-containing protein [Streptomyces calvus]GGP43843.1 amino acid adenylation protein [Streptomyces calvus]
MIKLASRPTEEQVAALDNAPADTAPEPHGTPADPHAPVAAALAAHLTLLHRRSLQERVTVHCRWAGSDEDRAGEVGVSFADGPTIGEVVQQAATGLAALLPEEEAEPPAAVDGAFEVLTGGAGPDGTLPGPVAAVTADAADGPALALRAGSGSRLAEPDRTGWEAALLAAYRAALTAPHTPVAELPLGDEAQCARWLGLGRPGRPAPPARRIDDLVAAQAARTPDALAVTGDGERLTYRRLEEEATALAGRLRARGVDRDAVVAVLMPRSVRLVVTLLAVLKAGGAYLALDPEDPAERHLRVLADSRARLLVADPALTIVVPDTLPVLDPTAPPTAAAAPVPVPPDPAGPDALAYISYTSGSTGEPRGVAVPHRAVSRLVTDPDWIDVSADDVFLHLAPVAFDASTWEIWTPLAHGARLAVAPAGAVELDALAGTLRTEGVTVAWLTAGLFHRMAGTHPDAFAGLRHVVAGGDVVSPGRVADLLASHPHLLFSNGYGPTENTTFTACWTTGTAPDGETVPIGRPVPGTHVAVLDSRLRAVPPGVAGELYAAGEGLARGYAGRPGASAERFLPDAVTGAPGGRMYRTGDLARWRPDGTLEFLGRADQQLKVQGFRVEPGFVEAELTRLDGVRDAVVIGQPDDTGGKRLLAYVVLDGQASGPDAAGARLREQLRATLPAAMLPWAVLIRSELPLNKNGKVDRRALPAATRVPRNVWNPFVAPRTATEQRLADLWGEVLGVEPVGVEDDFFDLGGHSLLVAELLGTLKDAFEVEVPARVLYLQPTIADLAGQIGD